VFPSNFRDRYFHHFDAFLEYFICPLILCYEYDYLIIGNFNLNTVIVSIKHFGFCQVLEREIMRVQVINTEQHYYLTCHKNEFFSGHHSIHRVYRSLTDMKQLLISMLIPHYQPLKKESYQVDRVSNMTERQDGLAFMIAFNQLILCSL
jgi:hypothetical protein